MKLHQFEEFGLKERENEHVMHVFEDLEDLKIFLSDKLHQELMSDFLEDNVVDAIWDIDYRDGIELLEFWLDTIDLDLYNVKKVEGDY